MILLQIAFYHIKNFKFFKTSRKTVVYFWTIGHFRLRVTIAKKNNLALLRLLLNELS